MSREKETRKRKKGKERGPTHRHERRREKHQGQNSDRLHHLAVLGSERSNSLGVPCHSEIDIAVLLCDLAKYLFPSR